MALAHCSALTPDMPTIYVTQSPYLTNRLYETMEQPFETNELTRMIK